MLTVDAITHFSTRTEIAKQLGITGQAVSQWGDLIPPFQARRLHELSNGLLKYDPADYIGKYPSHRFIPPAVDAA